MKKTCLVLVALLMGVQVFAQESEMYSPGDLSLSLYRSPNGKFGFDILSHLGYGAPILVTNDFNPSGSNELFVNIVDFIFRPTRTFGIKAGIDFMLQELNSRHDVFLLDADRRIRVNDGTAFMLDGYDYMHSNITVSGFSAPVLLTARLGRITLGAGANLQLNVWGSTYHDSEIINDGDNIYQRAFAYTREKKAVVTPFTYSLMGVISYREWLGVYFRYYPSKYSIVPQSAVSPQFGLMAVGVVVGF